MADIRYDNEVQILSIKISKNKIADSDVQKDCVIDYDKEGGIVNIDILGFDLEKAMKKSSPNLPAA